METNVRALEKRDIPRITDYWMSATLEYLLGMGADPEKMPTEKQFTTMLLGQLKTPYEKKKGFALIWEVDGQQVGHCNVNSIEYGKQAKMHLHLWQSTNRKKGIGTILVKQSLPFFFKKLELQTLICEPFAHNPAPNALMKKVGFTFIKTYRTTPGPINLEQEVSRYELTRKQWIELI